MDENLYIGVMSGTSMDGIDTVLASISDTTITTVDSYSIDFPDALKARLQSLTLPGHNEIDLLGEASVELGEVIATAINTMLKNTNIKTEKITAIGSHGQTIRHRPDAKKPFSLQIGDPSTIAHLTGITTVTDFRMADMAAQGQGAPLVPAFHQALLSSKQSTRLILNIGGIANISVLPPSSEKSSQLLGYDTGPGNMLMDQWIYESLGKPYDKNGDWARSGEVIESLLENLLNEPYFKRTPPKSTGKELFNLNWLSTKLGSKQYQDRDIQRTLLELSARSISNSVSNYIGNLYVCGGGVQNQFLMERLQTLLPSYTIQPTEFLGIDPQLVEATAFAWLARQAMHNLASNAPSVTGASQAKILGGIYPA